MHYEPTQEQGRDFVQSGRTGPVDMLNLLRFREVADYSASPELEPETPISGEEAYRLYIANTMPYLTESGGQVLHSWKGGDSLIGPAGERWDWVLVVRHRDVQTFVSFATNEGYLKGVRHRTAALADSRLLPMSSFG